MTFHAHASLAPREALRPFEYEPRALGPQDIEVKITHCGVCHSDLHLIDDDWSMSRYPLVPGHEIIGEVTAKGDSARLDVGQRVGIGWQRSACLTCDLCIAGDENLCARQKATCVGSHGGFADAIRADSRFAFAIPEKLSSASAAPLLCGGVTVFSPLRHFGVTPLTKVGVIGVGGLGHMAVQFARAFGCEVTAFSSSPAKEAEARHFGARHFVSSTDGAAMAAAAGTQDFLLNTVYADLDWNAYVRILRPGGTLCFVAAPAKPLALAAFPLLTGRKSVSGSPIGSRTTMREMLEFSARHGIEAQVEVVPMAEANAALDKVRANEARYRMVLAV